MTYHYLASPYSHANNAVEAQRYEAAQAALNWLLARRIWTYSPIVHCHAIARRFDLPGNAGYWASYNRAMLTPAIGLLVLDIDGWLSSHGIEMEIDIAREERIPINLLTPSGRTYHRKPFEGLRQRTFIP